MSEATDLRSSVAAELMREMVRQRAKPGFYLVRLVDGGPLVSAWVQQAEEGWRAIVNGYPMPWHPDPAYAGMLSLVALRGQPCTEGEYRFRLQQAEWAQAHDADAPEAKPMERYDPATARPVF
jgi:hypothetical protein